MSKPRPVSILRILDRLASPMLCLAVERTVMRVTRVLLAMALATGTAWAGGSAEPQKPTEADLEWPAPKAERARVNPVPATPEALKRGRSLFRVHCSVCHGDGGRGDGPAARPHARFAAAPRNLTRPDVQARLTEGEIFWKLSNGLRVRDRMVMPPFRDDIQSEEDRWMLVHFVRSLNTASSGGAEARLANAESAQSNR